MSTLMRPIHWGDLVTVHPTMQAGIVVDLDITFPRNAAAICNIGEDARVAVQYEGMKEIHWLPLRSLIFVKRGHQWDVTHGGTVKGISCR